MNIGRLTWKDYMVGVAYTLLVGLFVLWSEDVEAPLKPRWEFNVLFQNKIVYTYPRWFEQDLHCIFFGKHFESGLKDDRFTFVCTVKPEATSET